MRLFYGLRSANYAVFETELQRAVDSALDIEIQFLTEDGTVVDVSGAKASHDKGIIQIESIHSRVLEDPEPVYFLSGPPAMIESFSQTLRSVHVPAERIRIDNWE